MTYHKAAGGGTGSIDAMLQIAKATALYFAIVFGAGFVLGPVRVLVLEPWIEPAWAVLAEVPILLAVMVWAASFVVPQLAVPHDTVSLLMVGSGALVLQQLADVAVGIGLRGMSVGEILANFVTPPGLVYLAALVAFALMPWLVQRYGSRSAVS